MSEIKRTEKRMVEQEFTVEHVVTCDICGVKAANPGGYFSPSWREHQQLLSARRLASTLQTEPTTRVSPDSGGTQG